MIYKILRFLQLLLPFGLVLHMYKSDRALPTNIRTQSGRNLKAIMLTTDYGLIFSQEVYIQNRIKKLREQKAELDALEQDFMNQLNNLSFEEKEAYATIGEYTDRENN